MKISKEDILHIAKLSRLSLSDDEISRYADQLSVVFEYMEMLNDVDTDGVDETCQVTGLMDVVRDDVVVDCDEDVKKKIIAQFPESDGNLLKVKAVFE